MPKRTIKPAAGPSRVSTQQATSAARVVFRDSVTGHFVIVDGDRSSRVQKDGRRRETALKHAGGSVKERKDSTSRSEPLRTYTKKR